MNIIAEAGQCPGDSVEAAIDYAHQAHHAGATHIKFQLLRPETIAAATAPKYWVDDLGTESQREAFALAGTIDYGAWSEVKSACDEFGIEFLATPFDLEAVEALEDIGVSAYKIASGDLTYRWLIEQVAETHKPVFLSTGAAWESEILAGLGWCGDSDVTLLACTLAYPTMDGDANLARIAELLRRFGGQVGYSDHTIGVEAALGAAVLGATTLEKHFTLNPHAENAADHKMAVTPYRLSQYVALAKMGEKLRGDPRLAPCEAEMPARENARRSAFCKRDVCSGEYIREADVAYLRPDGPCPASHPEMLVGRRAKVDIQVGEKLSHELFDPLR